MYRCAPAPQSVAAVLRAVSEQSHDSCSTAPMPLPQDDSNGLSQVVAEVKLYGDVVLRYVSGDVVEVRCHASTK